jgi:hypothetical protein
VDGTNYLIPVDAILQRDTDVEDEAISMDRLLRILEPVKRLRLIILDACRENPFTRSMKRTIASRAIGRGLAKVEVVNSDTLIAFSAKAGSTALDGDGKNSPFTTALLNHLATPGQGGGSRAPRRGGQGRREGQARRAAGSRNGRKPSRPNARRPSAGRPSRPRKPHA